MKRQPPPQFYQKLGRGEDIVHAGRNTRKNMNKARLAEAGLGSPPFYI